MSYKVNTWITGIHLHAYETDMPDGTLLGFDADFGHMYAYNGRLVSESDLPGDVVREPVDDRDPPEPCYE